MKRVIHIFGASGSGTTTLGRALSEKANWFFMDTDDYFWLPTDPKYTQKRPAPERLALMKADLDAHENVVLSGSLTGWGDELIARFTLVVRLHTDTDLRIERLKIRERNAFRARLDEGGDMHEAHLAFLKWAAGYDTGDEHMRSKLNHDLWQKNLPCPVLELNGAHDVEANVRRVFEKLAETENEM